MAEYKQPLDTADQETEGQGALMKAGPKGALSPAGAIAMDPTQTSELLQNMQRIVEEREGPLAQFTRGLERASAWGSGGIQGPAQSLALINQQQAKEAQDVFNMRQQMAVLRAAQAQQEAFNKAQQQRFAGAGAGAGAGVAKPTGAGVPTVGGSGVVINGVEVDPETAAALQRARNEDEFNAIFKDFASKRSQARGAMEFGAPSYKKDIPVVNEEGKLEYIDAFEAQRRKNQGTLKLATPQGKPLSTQAIAQVESGGRSDVVSPMGARGVMQVMPNTSKDPGFGVTPAKDDSPEELKRVGEEYFGAMQNRYKDDTLAAIAYNMGPGKTDAWIQKGANFNDLPKETKDYIGKVYVENAKLATAKATPAPAAAAPAVPTKTIPEAQAEEKGYEAKTIAAGTASGKYIGGKEAEVMEAGSNSGERIASITNIEKYIIDPRTNRVFGVFEKPGFWNGIGAIVQSGIKLGQLGEAGFKDLDKLVASTMKDASQAEKDAAQIVTREFAKMKLQEAKVLLAGQGAVSDAERGLIAELTGSRLNSPGAIKEYLAWGRMRAEYDQKVGRAYDEWKAANPKKQFDEFRATKEARALREDYNNKLLDFAKSTNIDMGKAKAKGAELNEKDRSGQGPIMGGGETAKPAPVKWSHTDEEYNAWKRSKGIK